MDIVIRSERVSVQGRESSPNMTWANGYCSDPTVMKELYGKYPLEKHGTCWIRLGGEVSVILEPEPISFDAKDIIHEKNRGIRWRLLVPHRMLTAVEEQDMTEEDETEVDDSPRKQSQAVLENFWAENSEENELIEISDDEEEGWLYDRDPRKIARIQRMKLMINEEIDFAYQKLAHDISSTIGKMVEASAIRGRLHNLPTRGESPKYRNTKLLRDVRIGNDILAFHSPIFRQTLNTELMQGQNLAYNLIKSTNMKDFVNSFNRDTYDLYKESTSIATCFSYCHPLDQSIFENLMAKNEKK